MIAQIRLPPVPVNDMGKINHCLTIINPQVVHIPWVHCISWHVHISWEHCISWRANFVGALYFVIRAYSLGALYFVASAYLFSALYFTTCAYFLGALYFLTCAYLLGALYLMTCTFRGCTVFRDTCIPLGCTAFRGICISLGCTVFHDMSIFLGCIVFHDMRISLGCTVFHGMCIFLALGALYFMTCAYSWVHCISGHATTAYLSWHMKNCDLNWAVCERATRKIMILSSSPLRHTSLRCITHKILEHERHGVTPLFAKHLVQHRNHPSFALLALCEGNQLVDSPHKGPVMRTSVIMSSWDCCSIRLPLVSITLSVFRIYTCQIKCQFVG